MHRLEVPLHLSCRGIEAHQRFGEEIRSMTLASVVIATRRRCGKTQEAPTFIHPQRSPNIAVAVAPPGTVFPSLGGRIRVGLRDNRERPNTLPGPRVNGLYVTGGIGDLHSIRNLTSNDHQIFVNDGRRALSRMLDIGNPWQVDK